MSPRFATLLSHVAISFILTFVMAIGSNAEASGPAPPQVQEQPGQPITLEVDAHGSLFTDPLWSSGSQGTCRYLTNPSSSEWFVPIGSPTEWQSMETSTDNQYSENYATQQVCCRPSTGAQNATLCASAAGGAQSAQIVGSDPTSYGIFGSTGSATATCSNPPYGSYAETQTFTCGLDPAKPLTGTGADGAWSAETGDNRTCQPNAYTTYGGCSVTCGGGQLYKTAYDSCGEITSQGYSGPSCNTQSCCTPDYEFDHCNTSTAVYVDQNSCGGGNHNIAGACSLQSSSYPISCSPAGDDCIPNGCGGETCYNDCADDGDWVLPGCSVTTQCTPEGLISYYCSDGVWKTTGGPLCAHENATCTSTEWVQN